MKLSKADRFREPIDPQTERNIRERAILDACDAVEDIIIERAQVDDEALDEFMRLVRDEALKRL